MTISRTIARPVIQPPVGMPDAHCIEGAVAIVADFAITADSDTTVVIPCYGLIPWEIINESGAAATLTFANARSQNGTALSKSDQDSAPVRVITIGDDCSEEMQSALAGCTCLVITGALAASGFTMTFKR